MRSKSARHKRGLLGIPRRFTKLFVVGKQDPQKEIGEAINKHPGHLGLAVKTTGCKFVYLLLLEGTFGFAWFQRETNRPRFERETNRTRFNGTPIGPPSILGNS